MDYTLGSIWWLAIVLLMQIMAVFLVRGRPYSGDTIVTALFNQNSHSCLISWAPPLLSFTWNVILPVALTVTCSIMDALLLTNGKTFRYCVLRPLRTGTFETCLFGIMHRSRIIGLCGRDRLDRWCSFCPFFVSLLLLSYKAIGIWTMDLPIYWKYVKLFN